MKNPCSECLVKVNCTAICPDKDNFRILLNNARQQYQQGFIASTPHLRKLYTNYVNLDHENAADIHRINCRKMRVKHPESKTGSNI